MNLYLEASAAVKRYLQETGSREVAVIIDAAARVGTGAITRVEMTATLIRAARGGRISEADAVLARDALEADWPSFVQIPGEDILIGRAAQAAWDYGLRGYDAVHLASALAWQEVLGQAVTVATFDRELWNACTPAGLLPWPPDLSVFGASP